MVAVAAILVTELDPPPEVTPLEWMLLTNVPVTDTTAALERVHWYTLCWSIESFHRILKSGCAIEQCRFSTAARLTRYLTLLSIIAWELFWLTQVGRQHGDALRPAPHNPGVAGPVLQAPPHVPTSASSPDHR